MAGSVIRSRSTSVAVNAEAGPSKRPKQSRSNSHDSEGENAEVGQAASNGKPSKSQARRPPQTTKSRVGNTSTAVLPADAGDMAEASANTSKPSSNSQQSRKNAEKVARRISSTNERGLLQDHAELEVRFEEVQANYRAVREAYQELQDLRETGLEGTIREMEALTNTRLEALRKQVSTYARENEELRQQADALKEEIATLADRQEGDSSADKPKRRNVEEANDATMDTFADHEGSISSGSKAPSASARLSKEDGKALRDENEQLNARVAELHDEVAALSEEGYNLKKERKAMKKQWEADRQQLESNLKQQWERERLALLAEKEELMDKSAQLEKELAFEVEQSKKLQVIASQSAASQSKAAPNIPATSATSQSLNNSEELAQLLLDFTGMTVVRRPQEGDKTYNFVMTDFKKRKALNFKLIVDREGGSVDFIPDLLPGRDDEVIESMESAIRGHIKFEYDLIQTFFKRLWRALNGHK